MADGGTAPARKRADARRNERTLLEAAAAVFVAAGVDAPVRDIAAAAGVGMGTVYRHFPSRSDLVVAVYRHQVEACAAAGPALLAAHPAEKALSVWLQMFVGFLVTKHGLAAALQSDEGGSHALHSYFLDRLVPVCAQLLDACGDVDVTAQALMRAVGNLCIGAEHDPGYDARHMVALLVAGMSSRPGRCSQHPGVFSDD